MFICRPAYNPLYTNQYSQGTAAAVGTAGAILAALPTGLLPSGVGATGNANVYGSASQYLNTSNLTMGRRDIIEFVS